MQLMILSGKPSADMCEFVAALNVSYKHTTEVPDLLSPDIIAEALTHGILNQNGKFIQMNPPMRTCHRVAAAAQAPDPMLPGLSEIQAPVPPPPVGPIVHLPVLELWG
jgi:hypothetical protein